MESGDVALNGEQPLLAGQLCEGLVIEEYWHDGELVAPANVVWVRVNSAWHRLYFDGGVVFWRSHDGDAPKAYEMPELGAFGRLVDLGSSLSINGRVIVDVTIRAVAGGAEVEFLWGSGERLVFRDVDDCTSYTMA